MDDTDGIDIDDDDVPLGDTPTFDDDTDGIDIEDDDVPLGANPYTGVQDSSMGLAAGAAAAALAMGITAKKHKDSKDNK